MKPQPEYGQTSSDSLPATHKLPSLQILKNYESTIIPGPKVKHTDRCNYKKRARTSQGADII